LFSLGPSFGNIMTTTGPPSPVFISEDDTHAKTLHFHAASQRAKGLASSGLPAGPEDAVENEADKAPLETSRETDTDDGTEGSLPGAQFPLNGHY